MGTPDGPLLALAARVSDGALDEFPTESLPGRDPASAPGEAPPQGTLQALEEIARVAGAYRAVVRANDPVPASVAEPLLGRWGHFELIQKLGEGTSAEVFRAHDTRLDHDVALKLFKRTQLADAEKQLLLAEGRRHARVKHANIATIHDADEHDGRVGISMEYIAGSTLHEVVVQQGPHGSGEAAHIGIELCRAMAAIHAQGLVHGDIKAQNVMREKGGRIVVMDFSTSRPRVLAPGTAQGHFEGTPIYMAPELFEGVPHSPASDIYAVGVLLFYLATGDYPVKARSLAELRSAVLRDERRLLDDLRPDLPTGLSRVIHKAIARDPAGRFRSAGELQHALRFADTSITGEYEVDSSAREPRARPEDDVSTLVRVVRIAVYAAVGAAFLALLGYLNEFLYTVVLHVPEGFTDYSPIKALATGFRSLILPLSFGAAEIVLLALPFAVAYVFGRWRSPRRLQELVANLTRGLDYDRVATVYAVLTVGLATAAFVAYRPILSLLVELAEANGGTFVDVSPLSSDTKSHRLNLDLALSHLDLLLTAGWVCVFKLWRPATMSSVAAAVKWLSAFVIFAGVVLLTGPWRLLYNSGYSWSTALEDGARGCVAAERGADVFVWTPGIQGLAPTRQFVIPRDPRIQEEKRIPDNIFECGR